MLYLCNKLKFEFSERLTFKMTSKFWKLCFYNVPGLWDIDIYNNNQIRWKIQRTNGIEKKKYLTETPSMHVWKTSINVSRL